MIQIIKYSDNIEHIHYSSSSDPYLERNIMWSKGGGCVDHCISGTKKSKGRGDRREKASNYFSYFPS